MKYKEIVIAMDWDDTIVDTTPTLASMIHASTGWHPGDDVYLNSNNDRGHLKPLLDSGDFMALTKLRPEHVGLIDWMYAAKDRFPVRFVVATHRGYHAEAERLTADNVTRTGLPFSDIIYIDPKNHADKTAYLSAMFPRVVLTDDRPMFDGHGPLPPNVILYNQPWNQHMAPFKERYRVTNSIRMRTEIERFIRMTYLIEETIDEQSALPLAETPFSHYDSTSLSATIKARAPGGRINDRRF